MVQIKGVYQLLHNENDCFRGTTRLPPLCRCLHMSMIEGTGPVCVHARCVLRTKSKMSMEISRAIFLVARSECRLARKVLISAIVSPSVTTFHFATSYETDTLFCSVLLIATCFVCLLEHSQYPYLPSPNLILPL